jgi:hypothetical protein
MFHHVDVVTLQAGVVVPSCALYLFLLLQSCRPVLAGCTFIHCVEIIYKCFFNRFLFLHKRNCCRAGANDKKARNTSGVAG